MVRGSDPVAVATLYSSETPRAGAALVLGADVVRHLRALRLDENARVRVTDGRGTIAEASVFRILRDQAQLDIQEVTFSERGAEIHVLVPVADKDRMLWLAEKSVELGIASWRPVLWKRSRSVAGRGEGPSFGRRIAARMVSALEQSGGAWLPDMFPETNVDRAIAASPSGSRLILESGGQSLSAVELTSPVILAVGPEGGIEMQEARQFVDAGYTAVSVATNTLRFETAAIAGITLAHAGVRHNE